jgi:putative transposase
MDNHAHQIVFYNNELKKLSNYMRLAHGLFGRLFNIRNKRTGKVANERPRTPLIQNDSYAIHTHLYIEANPVRAGMHSPESLRQYKFSSFRYFAFGIKDETTRLLVEPEWYTALGKNPKNRQKAYRKLFYAYLRERGVIHEVRNRYFIGDPAWCQLKRDESQTQKPNDTS